MRSPGINGEGELRGQPANPGSPGKMAVKTECLCVCVISEKQGVLKTKLLLHERKLYLTYGMVLCLVTLTDV